MNLKLAPADLQSSGTQQPGLKGTNTASYGAGTHDLQKRELHLREVGRSSASLVVARLGITISAVEMEERQKVPFQKLAKLEMNWASFHLIAPRHINCKYGGYSCNSAERDATRRGAGCAGLGDGGGPRWDCSCAPCGVDVAETVGEQCRLMSSWTAQVLASTGLVFSNPHRKSDEARR